MDHARAAREAAEGRVLQHVSAAGRRCADRSADGFGNGGDVHASVGGDHGGGRELCGQPELRSLPRLDSGDFRVQTCDPDAPGTSGGADSVRRVMWKGRCGAEQHAFRHDAGECGVYRGRSGGFADGRGAAAGVVGAFQGKYGCGGAGGADRAGGARADSISDADGYE
jgi:hypothetical protein